MSYLIDLIIVAIIGICVFLSAKKGFVKTVVELIGFVLAVAISFSVSSGLADVTYQKLIEPKISETVTTAIEKSENDIENKAWNSLPDIIIENAEKFGISFEKFQKTIEDNISSGTDKTVQTVSNDIVKPIIVKLLKLIYSIALMFILIFVVRIIADLLNKLFSFSIIGKVNRILGGILGIPKGVIFALLFCMLISLLITVNNGFWIFTVKNVEKTILFKLFSEIIPL